MELNDNFPGQVSSPVSEPKKYRVAQMLEKCKADSLGKIAFNEKRIILIDNLLASLASNPALLEGVEDFNFLLQLI